MAETGEWHCDLTHILDTSPWLEKADLAKQAGAADPNRVAQQLRLLYDGASVYAHVDTSSTAVAAARAIAEMVLDQATHGRKSHDPRSKPRRPP
jgi:hypothetical protein